MMPLSPALLNQVSDMVISDINMLASITDTWVISKINIPNIISVKCSWYVGIKMEFSQSILQPYLLFCGG